MTSNDVAAGLLDQLNYLGGESGASILPAGFAFDLDFDSARAWPDLPYDTASPVSHYAPGGAAADPSNPRGSGEPVSSAEHPRRGSSSIESSTVP